MVAIPTVLLPAVIPCPAPTVKTILPVRALYVAAVGVNLDPDQESIETQLLFSDPAANIWI